VRDAVALDGSGQPRRSVDRVFIHVGAPKTGTTFIQGVLWRNRTALRDAGLHIVGQGRDEHYRAGRDIRGVTYDTNDPRPDWAGSWNTLTGMALASESPSVVISDEHLASLTPEQVRRAVDSLAPREVHVIYATRDLARLLASEYQEYVKHRSTLLFPEWSRRVFATRERGPGRWFWKVHDPLEVVQRWSTAIPHDRIHVVTLPPPGSDRNELWSRFAGIVGVDPAAATDFDVATNDSLGIAESEVLRRVNEVLPEDFPRWHHTGIARDVLATKILSPRSRAGRPPIPPKVQEKVLEQTQANVLGIAASGCDVVGDLSELEVTHDMASGERPATDAELVDASVVAIAGLLVRMGEMRDERRQVEGRLRRQLRESASMMRTRSRVAAVVDRTRIGAAALSRYRRFRARAN
jgi:hypothetical protein